MWRPELTDRLASADPARIAGRRSLRLWLASLVLHGSLLAALLITLPRIARGLATSEDSDAREVGIVLKSEKDDQVVFENPDNAFRTKTESAELNPPKLEDMEPPTAQRSSDSALPRINDSLLGSIPANAGAQGPRPTLDNSVGGGRSRTSFWNVESVGSSFVFVIDRSASMSHRGSLNLAKEQLLQALGRLTPTNKFQIIFYNTEAQPLAFGAGALIDASAANLGRARKEVERIEPEGGTQHTHPLELAFRFRPEVIYFLTDADMFNIDDVARMTALNRKAPTPATIYAIEFGNGPNLSADKPLRRLAAENDGAYSYINVQSFGNSLGNPQ